MGEHDIQSMTPGGLEELLADRDANMLRCRPYDGQSHTNSGTRGATEVKGITFRDLRDCFIRAVFLSAHHVVPYLYEEASKGERAALCGDDLYGWDANQIDLMAVSQNLSCEVEKLMGIFPNVPELAAEGER